MKFTITAPTRKREEEKVYYVTLALLFIYFKDKSKTNLNSF